MGLMYSPRSTGSGNATVPNDVPIMPVQSFVDAAVVILVSGNGTVTTLTNLGIISIADTFLDARSSLASVIGDPPEFDFSGNALTASSVNSILAFLVVFGTSNGVLNLSGGTNVAPTGQGIADKNTLIAAGWTVTTN